MKTWFVYATETPGEEMELILETTEENEVKRQHTYHVEWSDRYDATYTMAYAAMLVVCVDGESVTHIPSWLILSDKEAEYAWNESA